jgi:hypothetical protein
MCELREVIKGSLSHYQRVVFSVNTMLPWQGNRWRFFIWRNGAWRHVEHVVEANTQERWLVRHALKDGHPYLDETGERPATERLEGWIYVQDVGSFWRELFGAVNWVLLESRFGRTLFPGSIMPYKMIPTVPPTEPAH